MRIKTILIGIIILIFIGLVAFSNLMWKKYQDEKRDRIRLETNQEQLLSGKDQQIVTINLKNKEVAGRLKQERDSIAELLKIKPKQIEKIIYTTLNVTDAILKPILAINVSKGIWNIADSSKCFKWSANAVLKGDSLIVNRTFYSSSDSIVQAFYKKRPHKFLFIRWGKWNYLQKISSNCSNVTYKAFIFEK